MNAINENTLKCKFCGSIATIQREQPTPPPSPAPARGMMGGVDVYDKNINGILELSCQFSDFGCAGSGLLIDNSGYAITNAHVVSTEDEVCTNVTVRICGKTTKAKVINLGDDCGGNGPGLDLALIKIDSLPNDATPVTFADFDATRNGEPVYVIGNSLGDGTCITSGIVSDKSRTLAGQRLLMTDCAINGGNSGGPIFNSMGEAIGVIVCSRIQSDGSATEGMNYAIPADNVEEFILGDHVAIATKRLAAYDAPKRFASCPVCSKPVQISVGERCVCKSCSKSWTHRNIKR
jgi:S1-C subfamily serine protease